MLKQIDFSDMLPLSEGEETVKKLCSTCNFYNPKDDKKFGKCTKKIPNVVMSKVSETFGCFYHERKT